MRRASTIDPLFGPSRYAPQLRLVFGRVLFRVFVLVFVISEFSVWGRLRFMFRGQARGRRLGGMILFTPAALCLAFVTAAVVAVVADLIVRWIVRPVLARWYDPRPVDASLSHAGVFHLASNEKIEGELPARLIDGRNRAPGSLVFTNKKLWFFPHAWDAAPQSIDRRQIAAIQLQPPPIAAWNAIKGWPDEITVHMNTDQSVRFALADTSAFLDWFEDSDVPRFLHHD
jgi:hypothetical protein